MTPDEHAFEIELRRNDIADAEAREARAVRRAEVTLACIYAASWIMAAGGVWAWMGKTLIGAR